jgi:hypothetical protein
MASAGRQIAEPVPDASAKCTEPAMMRSEDRRLGTRFRPRLRIRTWLSHQHGFGNNGTEPARPSKPDNDCDGMQKKSKNVAHSQDGINQDGIKRKKLKN